PPLSCPGTSSHTPQLNCCSLPPLNRKQLTQSSSSSPQRQSSVSDPVAVPQSPGPLPAKRSMRLNARRCARPTVSASPFQVVSNRSCCNAPLINGSHSQETRIVACGPLSASVFGGVIGALKLPTGSANGLSGHMMLGRYL